MSLADGIKELEGKAEKAEAFLKAANQAREKLSLAKDELQKQYDRLLAEFNDTAGLREEIKQLKARLKLERESVRVSKLKATNKKLHVVIAEEQSKRMQAENKPEAVTENERLKARVESLERDLPGHRANSAKVLQYEREAKLLMKQIDAYEAKMRRQKLAFTRIPGLTINVEMPGG